MVERLSIDLLRRLEVENRRIPTAEDMRQFATELRAGLGAVPRTLIANYIGILAARRAIFLYLRSLAGQPLRWDKTQHRFPDLKTDP